MNQKLIDNFHTSLPDSASHEQAFECNNS